MKVSLFASTLISSTVLLTAFSGHQAFAADIVTKNNAQEVASEALSNSGGNPDLQNFGKVIDKRDYFEIKSHNKANAGLGVYKVHKMAKSNIKMINIVTLINFKVEKHMLNTVLQMLLN